MSTRRALVDTSLMARASTRRFLGLLAEAKGVMLVSTQETQEELPRALHRVVASRNARHNFDMKLREEQQSLRLWQKRYMESGLYQQLDLSHTPLSDTDFAFLSERWEATRSDPDDFHLAYDALAHKIDAVFTSNFRMTDLDEWQQMMIAISPDNAPVLCRSDEVLDWVFDQRGVSERPEIVLNVMLSAFLDGHATKDRALGWAHALAHSFPTMKKSLLEHVERMSEHEFYMLHQKALGLYEIPITRQAMSIESRS